MPTVTLDLTLLAPIPVGHRVRLSFYRLHSRGLFGGSSEVLEHEPVIEDLDTGIVYCTERPFDHDGVKRPRVPLGVRDQQLLGDLDHVVEGRVQGCRVLTVRGFSEADVSTQLAIEIA
jgi:hypothetical protein